MSTSRLQNIVAAMGLLVGGRQAGTRRPVVPPSVQASAGEEVVLAAPAKGVQIYVCQEGPDQKLTWVLKRPEAELTDATETTIALHTAGSTWKHVDGSEVMGKVVAKEDAPKPHAIPWLLLTAAGPRGEGVFSRVTSIPANPHSGWVAAGSEYLRCLGEREESPERVCGGLFLLRAGVEVREENVGLLRSAIFIPILFGDVVLRHFVSDDFAFVGIGGVFHALHDLCLERVSLLEQFVHAF